MNVSHIGIIETAYDMHDRIHIPYVAEKLIPQSLAPASTLHQTGDVDKLHRGISKLGGIYDSRDIFQSWIGNRDDADIRIDRTEGIIRHLGTGGGEGIKDGGLADVWKTYDSTPETHSCLLIKKKGGWIPPPPLYCVYPTSPDQ